MERNAMVPTSRLSSQTATTVQQKGKNKPSESSTKNYFNLPKIERLLDLAPDILTGEKLMLIPLMPEHCYQLYNNIFSNPVVMKYFGMGKSFSYDEYKQIHFERVNRNIMPEHSKFTGYLTRFTWTILTHEGIAGRINIFPTLDKDKERTELAFCVSPEQQGRALAKHGSELIVRYLGENTFFIATVHPENKASIKTIENIRDPSEEFVFFKDPERQNVPKYGQFRNYYLSKEAEPIKFYSFYKRQIVTINPTLL